MKWPYEKFFQQFHMSQVVKGQVLTGAWTQGLWHTKPAL